jgi:hypothetical protein
MGIMLKLLAKLGVLLVAVIYLSGVGNTTAQTPSSSPSGLAVSPPTFELSANPGDTLRNSLRVDNVVNEDIAVSVDVRNFTALGEEGGIDLSQEEGQFSLASWTSVTPKQVTIPAHGFVTFNYTIAIPANAPPGGRFGSIIFKTTPKPVTKGSGVAVGQEVGALVFLKIAGDVSEKATIATFKPRSTINEGGPVYFDVRTKNNGNVQLRPTGTVTITNIFGKKVATVPVNEENVLPGAIRKAEAKWNSGVLFGRYNATVSLVYGSERQVLTASTAFWGFPYKIIGIMLLIVAALGGLIYPRRKRLGRAFKILFGRD